ncbi:hypothetical protein [Metamycoplasma canadense]|uniref:Lipoprotein n=1 Tax=Metamycoplasma canadense TaxID=29554 RepID=A0A077L946_9BACT|nr:hypothetical protein [Metamycoplasma canadense]BAP39528.1 hypothetical protein MCAN360_0335 [Metamycoplasma canadense]
MKKLNKFLLTVGSITSVVSSPLILLACGNTQEDKKPEENPEKKEVEKSKETKEQTPAAPSAPAAPGQKNDKTELDKLIEDSISKEHEDQINVYGEYDKKVEEYWKNKSQNPLTPNAPKKEENNSNEELNKKTQPLTKIDETKIIKNKITPEQEAKNKYDQKLNEVKNTLKEQLNEDKYKSLKAKFEKDINKNFDESKNKKTKEEIENLTKELEKINERIKTEKLELIEYLFGGINEHGAISLWLKTSEEYYNKIKDKPYNLKITLTKENNEEEQIDDWLNLKTSVTNENSNTKFWIWGSHKNYKHFNGKLLLKEIYLSDKKDINIIEGNPKKLG